MPTIIVTHIPPRIRRSRRLQALIVALRVIAAACLLALVVLLYLGRS